MKIASIDIGSNTVILLIIEIENKSIISEKNFFRIGKLGKNLTAGGLINYKRIKILLKIFDEFFTMIEEDNCDKIFITATNALRIASNGNEIANLILSKFGTNVDVIPGELEAMYSFLGAAFNYSDGDKNNLIIDIGGGSTEIIIGTRKDILFKKSFQIGTVALTDKFISASKANANEIIRMEKFTREIFNGLNIYSNMNLTAFGVGGTPTSLSGMLQNIFEYNEGKIEGSFITKAALDNLSGKLSRLSSSEILEKYKKMVEGRNDVIFAGSIILKVLFETFNLNEITVSGKGLRYGVVYSKYLT